MEQVQFQLESNVSDKMSDVLRNVFKEYNAENDIEPYDKKELSIELTHKGEIIGGLSGDSAWNWRHVKELAVRKEFRGGGYGVQLLDMAEKEALKRGCIGVYLSTMSFQALDFYKKAGYVEYGCLEGNPFGHSRIMMKKKIG